MISSITIEKGEFNGESFFNVACLYHSGKSERYLRMVFLKDIQLNFLQNREAI